MKGIDITADPLELSNEFVCTGVAVLEWKWQAQLIVHCKLLFAQVGAHCWKTEDFRSQKNDRICSESRERPLGLG